jgi:hypothetical protein
LSESWDNASLKPLSIQSEVPGLKLAATFLDEAHQMLCSLGAELVEDKNPELAYWTLDVQEPRGAESLGWVKTIIPFDDQNTTSPIIANPVGGTYTYDEKYAYYAGGHFTQLQNYDGTHWKSSIVKNTGLTRFDFAKKQLTNYANDVDLFGPIFNVPFGESGTLISFEGSKPKHAEHRAIWSNVTIFDKETNTYYHQSTTGEVPNLGSSVALNDFAFFSGIDEKYGTFEL